MSDPRAECQELVQRHDRDRFLSTLFAPDDRRPHLLALYAFNVEVVRIRDAVTEPQLGLIRLQWWRDTVESLYEGQGASGHPVAEALGAAIAQGRLPKQALLDLITAHECDLYDDPMPDVTALEAYLGETSSRLIQMAAMILDPAEAPRASEAAGLGGVAQGLALVLGDPRHRDPFLPPGMSLETAIAHARKRLTEAQALLPSLPKSLLPAFLTLSLTDTYLKQVAKAPHAPLAVSPLRRQFIMWWTARRW
jgi:phytoene synthase